MATKIKPVDHMPGINDGITSQSEIDAIKALVRGAATGPQQIKALQYIMSRVCGMSEPPRAIQTEREAGFAAGSLHVGMVIATLGEMALWQPIEENNDD